MEIIRAQLGETEDSTMLDLVIASAGRASSLVRQVLSFARGGDGQRVTIPPNTLVDEIGGIVRATFPKTIAFQSRHATDAWPFFGDATQFHQVLLNLCVNARDAMPRGGTLTLAVDNAEIDELQAAAELDAVPGRYVVFTVTDTGTGIPEGLREKIFDPFFTTKAQGNGTGLGLATTLGIVRDHGGFISLSSEEGKGTTFRVSVPADDSLAMNNEPCDGIETADLQGNGELILVVDDEIPILSVIRTVLENAGYRVLCGADGVEGIKAYAQNIDEIHAVITDIQMPLVEGTALISALKRLKPAVKVIVTTGMASEANIEALKHLGVERILTKPYGTQAILLALSQTLGGSIGRSDSPRSGAMTWLSSTEPEITSGRILAGT